MASPGWKQLKSPNGEVRYHVMGEDFVDEILIKQNNEEELTIKYTIDGVLVIRSKNTEITIKPTSNDFEDPFFIYETYFNSVANVEEAIKDIKEYILEIVKYALSLE